MEITQLAKSISHFIDRDLFMDKVTLEDVKKYIGERKYA